MTQSETGLRLIAVPEPLAEEAAEVLTQAFVDYPMMRYFFGEDPGHRRAMTHRIFSLSLRQRLVTGWPALAVEHEGGLVGALIADAPGPEPGAPEIDAEFERFAGEVGEQTAGRFESYMEMKDRYKPDGLFYYITAVGVLASARGRGAGRLMMDAIHARAEAEDIPVGLDTQARSNVGLYEHLGYRVTATDCLDDVPMWFMVR
jgi:ribosomal protein S18 acetylase RimI-like enzyme